MKTFEGVGLVVVGLCLAFGVSGCAGKTATETAGDGAGSAPDGITAEELAAGASWDGSEEGAEPDDAYDDETVDDANVEQLESDSASGSGSGSTGSTEWSGSSEEAASSCRNVRGYRRGRAEIICVTTIDGHIVEAHTAERFRVMQEAARQDGVDVLVVSGWRSMQKQRWLYQAYLAGRGNLAAPPGFSSHQSGHALDLNESAPGVTAWLHEHAADYGFERTVPSERWHYEDP